MKPVDLIALLVLGVLVVLAIWRSKKHPDCTGDCLACKTSCSKKDPNDVPRFVKLYRRDHPKPEASVASKAENRSISAKPTKTDSPQ